MRRGELFNKHTRPVIFFSNISNETTEIVNFHFSHYKSMGTLSCYSNQLFVPPTYSCYMCNMKIISFTASEEKSFENVDDGRKDG